MWSKSHLFLVKRVKGYSNLYSDICPSFLSKPGDGGTLLKSHPVRVQYVFPKWVTMSYNVQYVFPKWVTRCVKAHTQQRRTVWQELTRGPSCISGPFLPVSSSTNLSRGDMPYHPITGYFGLTNMEGMMDATMKVTIIQVRIFCEC